MNNKELRKLNRKELLEIILEQMKRIEGLELELRKAKSELNSKKINIEESGSIAEAVIKLSGIFETAQKTADHYVSNVKENSRKLEIKMQKDYEKQKEKMLKKVEKECQDKKRQADEYFKEVEQKAKDLAKDKPDVIKNVKKTKGKKKS